jgi:hypothetical protein
MKCDGFSKVCEGAKCMPHAGLNFGHDRKIKISISTKEGRKEIDEDQGNTTTVQ